MASVPLALGAIVAIFALALAGALLPLLVIPIAPELTRFGNAFAAGFLSSAAIVHLLPSGHEAMRQATGPLKFPLDGLATLAGATSVFLLDVLLRRVSHSHMPHSLKAQIVDPEALPLVSAAVENIGKVEKAEKDGIGMVSPVRHMATCGNSTQVASARSASRIGVATILAMTLSFHSLVEGLSLGVSLPQPDQFTVVALAVLAHKLFAALALGAALSAAVANVRYPHAFQAAVCAAVGFASFTPIGVIVGSAVMASSVSGGVLTASLNCASAGVFLYVAFVDLLAEEVRDCSGRLRDSLLRCLMFVGAAGIMSVMAIWT